MIMPIRSETIALQHPTIRSLPRVTDRVTFLHLSEARIVQGATGVVAHCKDGEEPQRVAIPTASIAALLLGPGTSITQPALATIARHGTSLVWVGADGSRTHGWSYALTSSSRWIEAQAALWADPAARRAVAVAMYEKRFGELPEGELTLPRLRGLEGQRMRKLYQHHARQHGLRFRRSYDPENFDDSDSTNQALSAANAALYGVCAAAIVALGCHPGLGFIHAGNISAFVFDIADLYKADVAVPAAFAAATHPHPAKEARRLTRESLVQHNVLANAVNDIQQLLAPGLAKASPNEHSLLDETGYVDGGTNYAPHRDS